MNRVSPLLVRTLQRSAPQDQDDLSRRRQAAFQAAKLHSRRVHLLRRVLPIVAGVALVLVSLWLYFDPLRYVRDLPVSVGALKISGTKLTMEAPRLTGYSKDGHPYSITAKSAAQDLTRTSVIELNDIVGKFTTSERGETVLSAANGVYDSKTEQMHLFGGIKIRSDEGGYSGVLQEAVGEPKKGHMVSQSPVAITFNEGNLRSDRVEVLDHGKAAIFTGNVVVNLKDSAIKLDDETASASKRKKK
ncbi:MAG TPA: LPS export ABC transporter periplasmic protein LptC [Xanthobacteraceae bacterium]|nr:LPS export ABC transporter periplasmic protein LptC [Xanthobacteraceae bacterium]